MRASTRTHAMRTVYKRKVRWSRSSSQELRIHRSYARRINRIHEELHLKIALFPSSFFNKKFPSLYGSVLLLLLMIYFYDYFIPANDINFRGI